MAGIAFMLKTEPLCSTDNIGTVNLVIVAAYRSNAWLSSSWQLKCWLYHLLSAVQLRSEHLRHFQTAALTAWHLNNTWYHGPGAPDQVPLTMSYVQLSEAFARGPGSRHTRSFQMN